MSETLIAGIAVAVGMVIRELMAGFTKFVDTWQRNQEAKRSATAREEELHRAAKESEASQLLDRQEKQIARKDAQIEALQKVVNETVTAHSDCREEVAEMRLSFGLLYDYTHRLYDYTRRQNTVLSEHGVKMEPIEPMPERPPPRKQKDVDFSVKTVGQTSKNLAAIDAWLHEKPGETHADSGN